MRMDQVSGSAMRFVSVAAAAAAVFMIAATPAAACCHRVGPAYGVAVVPVGALDSWYPVRQVYVVNQGPVFTGPGIYAYSNFYLPTVGPYPYAPSFPYVRGEIGCHGGVERCYYGYRHYWRGHYAHGPVLRSRD
jgi:hypothetical protein